MRRVGAFLIIFLIIIVSNSYTARCQWDSLDKESHDLIEHGIRLVHEEDYSHSLQLFESLIRLHPDKPMGHFLVAAVYQIIMRNYRTKAYEDRFERSLNRAIKAGKTAIRRDRENSLNYFYLGGAYGYRGLHKFSKKNWIGAYFDGLKGMKYLGLALQKDPDLYDAYYGLGTFHYWLGAKSKLVRFLFFYSGDRQQGIDELDIALQNGRYTRIEAGFALTLIFYNEKNYDQAMSLNRKLYGLFPSNPSCLYMRSRLFEKKENWKEAKSMIQKLLQHLALTEYGCQGYKTECHYWMAYYDYKMGCFESARNHCIEALRYADRRNPKMELEGPLEHFKQILKQTNRLYDQLGLARTGGEDGGRGSALGDPLDHILLSFPEG